LYKGGATGFLDVLSAQQTYLQNYDLVNQGRREHALAAVALYRALGGGVERTPSVITSSTPTVLSESFNRIRISIGRQI